MTRVPLAGSLGNWGKVFREGDVVVRPVGPHTPAATALLDALAAHGFPAPRPLGQTDSGEQRLSWIEGEVPAAPPFPEWSSADRALASVGRLLRRYHQVAAGLALADGLRWAAEFADPEAGDASGGDGLVICHNDVCPPNVVFRHGEAVALLDFDFAAPGRPVWDLAQSVRMWARLRPVEAAESVGADYEPFRRMAVLVAGYGLDRGEHAELVDAIPVCWRVGMAFIQARMAAGQAEYVEIWERHDGAAGHERALAWLAAHREVMLAALARGDASSVSES